MDRISRARKWGAEKLNATVNVSALDLFEQRQLKKFMADGMSQDRALQIMVNTVEGDSSQLSPELKKWARSSGVLNSKLAEEMVEEISPSTLSEQRCIDYALVHGYTKYDGQRAWQEIFKGMKALNAKLGLAVGDKVRILIGENTGMVGKVTEAIGNGNYLVKVGGGWIKAVNIQDLELVNGKAGVFNIGDKVVTMDGAEGVIVEDNKEYYVVKVRGGTVRMRELDLEDASDRYNAKKQMAIGEQAVIPTGNAQLVYSIDGRSGETFTVSREGTMVPPGRYKVVSSGNGREVLGKGFSDLTVERVA